MSITLLPGRQAEDPLDTLLARWRDRAYCACADVSGMPGAWSDGLCPRCGLTPWAHAWRKAIDELEAVRAALKASASPHPEKGDGLRAQITRLADAWLEAGKGGENDPAGRTVLRHGQVLRDTLKQTAIPAPASPGSGEHDSILDVKLWIHEWCQRNGYPGGTAAIGVDGATELLRCDRLARIDSGRTMTLAEAAALPASEGQKEIK